MITGYPFNGVAYSAEDVAASFADIVSNGANIYGNSGALKVSAGSGMAVNVADGTGRINGRMFRVTNQVLAVDAGTSTARKDRVVIKMDAEAGQDNFTIYIKKGGTAAPSLTRNPSGTICEISLATLTITNSTISIQDDRGDVSLCGYVSFLGNEPFYPTGTIPENLWLYTVYPDELTAAQKSSIESDPALMAKYRAGTIYQNAIYTGAKKIVSKSVPSGNIPGNDSRTTTIQLGGSYTNVRIYPFAIELNLSPAYGIKGDTFLGDTLPASFTSGNMSASISFDGSTVTIVETNSSSSTNPPIFAGTIRALVR